MNATKSLVLFAVLCAVVTCHAAPPKDLTVKSYTFVGYQPKPVHYFWFRWFWLVLP